MSAYVGTERIGLQRMPAPEDTDLPKESIEGMRFDLESIQDRIEKGRTGLRRRVGAARTATESQATDVSEVVAANDGTEQFATVEPVKTERAFKVPTAKEVLDQANRLTEQVQAEAPGARLPEPEYYGWSSRSSSSRSSSAPAGARVSRLQGASIKERLPKIDTSKLPELNMGNAIRGVVGAAVIGLAIEGTVSLASSDPKPAPAPVARPMRADVHAEIIAVGEQRVTPSAFRAESITLFDNTTVYETRDTTRTDNIAEGFVPKGQVKIYDGAVPVAGGLLEISDLNGEIKAGATDAETATHTFYIRDPEAPGVKTTAEHTSLNGFKSGAEVVMGMGGAPVFEGTDVATAVNPLQESVAAYKGNQERAKRLEEQRQAAAATAGTPVVTNQHS